MKALCLQAPKHLELIDIKAATQPNPGEALVRVHRVGICGSDISGYLGKMPFYSYPQDNEATSWVLKWWQLAKVSLTSDQAIVARLSPISTIPTAMQAVTAAPTAARNSKCWAFIATAACDRNSTCRPGNCILPPSFHSNNSPWWRRWQNSFGCHATNRADPKPDETCLIIGAGPIGLATLEFVKLTGCKIVVLDVNAQRLEFCRARYGHTTYGARPSRKQDHARVDEQRDAGCSDRCHGLEPIDVERVGANRTWGQASVRRHHHERGDVSPRGLPQTEGNVACSRNACSADFTRIIGLIEQGRIDTKPWITHRVAFEELIDVFSFANVPETVVIKAIVDVGL